MTVEMVAPAWMHQQVTAGQWRVEQAATGAPIVYTYVLDPATGRYRDSEIFIGVVKLTVPFTIEIDLGEV
jgi:hypothetical protein